MHVTGYVSEAVIKRLPGYYRHLRELESGGIFQISSQELGKRMGLTASQIRQDINSFGGFGRQGCGYSVQELKKHIMSIMGIDKKHRMIIIGAGNIGCAVARYPSFTREGFQTIAIFDKDNAKIGLQVNEITVKALDELDDFVRHNRVDIAVFALPANGAQAMLDQMLSLGIKTIWNFAPIDLKTPKDVVIVNVHLSDSLHILSYKMTHTAHE
ncbi:MAG: redox-sensing transcriptional repressor Rex [Clostridia bacterium]|nr:redox-sensing transcriptional repressor Rex [Clostridia bacterium]